MKILFFKLFFIISLSFDAKEKASALQPDVPIQNLEDIENIFNDLSNIEGVENYFNDPLPDIPSSFYKEVPLLNIPSPSHPVVSLQDIEDTKSYFNDSLPDIPVIPLQVVPSQYIKDMESYFYNPNIRRRDFIIGKERREIEKGEASSSHIYIETPSSESDHEDDIIKDSDCVCRLDSKNKIVGGEEVKGSIPWQASLAFTNNNVHFCGATIINQHYVLTSAICATSLKEQNIKVRVGLRNIMDKIQPEKIYDVEKILPFISTNPYISDPLGVGDIALLKLKTKIKFIPGVVEPACLNFIHRQYTDKLMVSGWGNTKLLALDTSKKFQPSGKLSSALKIAYLNPYTKNCEKNHLICAKSFKNDSPCKGDLGGPLHSNVDSFTFVEGVLSKLEVRTIVNDPNRYYCLGSSFYSRISFYKYWFERIIGNNYCFKYRAEKRIRDISDDPKDKGKRIKIQN